MTEVSVARLEAVEALRQLAHALVAHDTDDQTLEQTTAQARQLAAVIRRAPPRKRELPDFADIAATPSDDPRRGNPLADRAVAGPANPMGVEISALREGDEVVATVRFGPAFQGAPGRVHGGMVAAIFDDVTGYVLGLVGKPAFTGKLTVTYQRPVPLDTPLEFRARLRDQQGRKLVIEAEARQDGEVLSTAEALFVIVDPRRFEPAPDDRGTAP